METNNYRGRSSQIFPNFNEIQTVLKEFPVVFWLDTSTFFAGNMTIDDFMDRVNVTDYEVVLWEKIETRIRLGTTCLCV